MASTINQTASLTYLQWQALYSTEKPFQVFATTEDASKERLTNLIFAQGPQVTIHNIRGQEDKYTLDNHGFIARRHEMPAALDMSTEEAFRRNVVPLHEDLIRREVDGVDFIYCFDWGFRKNVEILRTHRMNVNDKMHRLNPGRQVHCDQSPTGALGRLQEHIPHLVEVAEAGRLRIFNIWRPLDHVVKDNTLAVCDGSTIKDSDMVEADHISRTYHGNTMYGLYSPSHTWHYLHHQSPDEVLIFKIFDSDPSVKAKRSLHAAFDYNTVPPDTLPRESMEIRFLVVTAGQSDTKP
ncbi:hypothetical protein MaudMau93_007630 [Microsporum audouinii]